MRAKTRTGVPALLAAGLAMCCAAAAVGQTSIPSNDLCSGATALTLNTPVIGSATNATAVNDGPSPECQVSAGFRGVWFTFVPPTTQRYQISSCHSAFDTTLQVYTAVDCTTYNNASFVPLPGGCNDDQCGGGPGPGITGSTLGAVISNIRLNAGATYWIRLSGFGATGFY